MEEEPKLSDVLEAVKKGFDGVDERFDRVEGRLDKVEGRLDNVERKLDKVDGKVNTLVNVLKDKNVITKDDKSKVHA